MLAGMGLHSPVFAGLGLHSPVFAGLGLHSPVFAGLGLHSPVFAGLGLHSALYQCTARCLQVWGCMVPSASWLARSDFPEYHSAMHHRFGIQ